MTKEKPAFALPPRPAKPQSAEEFIAGAARSDTAPAATAQKSAPAATKERTIEDLDHARRIQQWPLRLTERESEVLSLVYGQGGFRSKHDYVLRAAQRQLEADYERLTGRKLSLGPEVEHES